MPSSQVGDVAEDQRAGGVLNEQVEELRLVDLEAELQLVVAGVDIGDGAELVDLGLEVVGRAREARARPGPLPSGVPVGLSMPTMMRGIGLSSCASPPPTGSWMSRMSERE